MLKNIIGKKVDQRFFMQKQFDKNPFGMLFSATLRYIKVKQIVVLLYCIFLLGCGGQTRPIVSPSGKYALTIPKELNPDFHKRFGVWMVTIKDSTGRQLYKDTSSTFVGTLSVYWLWDDNDRVWLYNSDDGLVWFWELTGENWVKTNWGRIDLNGKSEKIIERNIEHPEMLYPYKNKK